MTPEVTPIDGPAAQVQDKFNPLLIPMVHNVRNQIQLNPMTIEQLTSLLKSNEGVIYFEGKRPELQCMDGRINGGDGMAGSGILLERDENGLLPAPRYMQIFQQRVNEGKLQAICWHKDCGAAKLYLKNTSNPDPTSSEVDDTAKDFSTRLADHLGTTVKETVNEMPHHDEQGIYIDATDRFNEVPEGADQLPNGFVLSPLYTGGDFDYHMKEIEVAIEISFGDHGAGAEAFTPEKSYFIMLINDPKNPEYFGNFAKQIEDMIAEKFPNFIDKIQIQSIAPQI